jgi:azurin
MNFLSPFILLFLFFSVIVSLVGKSDYDVVIGTRHAQLRFSKEVFAVKPGSRVNLTLDNSDEMIHNLVLAKGDSSEINRLAELALNLGELGMKMGFVPQDPSIIASIGLVQPGEKSTVQFIAPLEKGDYSYVCTFPGHSLTMRGVMKVVDDPSSVNLAKIKIASPGTTPKNGILEVGAEARVVRVHVSGVNSGRSIAVGLPGGFNYLFDAEKLMIPMGWSGPFLNVSRDRRSRGGGPCSILGKKFEVGSSEFPLRVGNTTKVPEVRFGGYSRLDNPEFKYEIDGVKVNQTATGSPGGQGLTYGFRVMDAPADLYFLIKPEGMRVSTTSGEWVPHKGFVKIPANKSSEFFISVEQI